MKPRWPTDLPDVGQGDGPHFNGGPGRDVERMIAATAQLRDVGQLPAVASLVLSQLLLNAAGAAGRGRLLLMIDNFLTAADAPIEGPAGGRSS
jgi:hypothetical protein